MKLILIKNNINNNSNAGEIYDNIGYFANIQNNSNLGDINENECLDASGTDYNPSIVANSNSGDISNNKFHNVQYSGLKNNINSGGIVDNGTVLNPMRDISHNSCYDIYDNICRGDGDIRSNSCRGYIHDNDIGGDIKYNSNKPGDLYAGGAIFNNTNDGDIMFNANNGAINNNEYASGFGIQNITYNMFNGNISNNLSTTASGNISYNDYTIPDGLLYHIGNYAGPSTDRSSSSFTSIDSGPHTTI